MPKPPEIEFPEIEDDAPGAATADVAVVIEAAPAAPSDEPQQAVEAGVEQLRAQLEQERAEKERERAGRLAAEQAADASRGESRDSHLVAVSNSIALAQQELDGIEAAHAAAMEGGDFKGAAKLQREMVSKENKLSQLENGRVALEESIARGAQRPVVTEGRVEREPAQRQMTVDERVEDLAGRITPTSAQWLRANKQVMDAPRKLAAAHDHATQVKGLAIDTPAYFASLEADLGLRAPAAPRRPATVSAPVNRESAPTINGVPAGRVINLSKKQQDTARDLDMSNEEYAKGLYEDLVARGLVH